MTSQKKTVFVLLYEGDVVGVFENVHEAELTAYQAKSPKENPWRIDETTYYYKED